jgi:SRSO17 transposase
MTILEHPDAQALLDEAVLTEAQVLELGQHLQPFLQRYLPLFQRAEQRQHATRLLQGKLSALSRKTAEPIAHACGARRENLQDFLGASPWDDDGVLKALRTHVQEVWADPQGVLLGDGSGFPKKGEHSCGVQRQYCGRLGKVENCQIGLFLGYACRHGQVLLQHRLFLPPEWVNDPARRAEAGLPDSVVYQEMWEILLAEVDTCQDVPHAWFVADREFGRVNAFRAGLRDRAERYVVDVRADLRMRDLRARPPERRGTTGRVPTVPPETSAQEWAEAQPTFVWQQFEIRGGEKKPLRVEAAQTWVETFEDTRVGPQERLVVIRTVQAEEAQTWYTLSNAGAEVPLGQVVWAHAQRYWEEAAFKEGKSEVGLDEYEVRSWRGWHHHMTLSLLALWFLALERAEVKKKRQRSP